MTALHLHVGCDVTMMARGLRNSAYRRLLQQGRHVLRYCNRRVCQLLRCCLRRLLRRRRLRWVLQRHQQLQLRTWQLLRLLRRRRCPRPESLHCGQRRQRPMLLWVVHSRPGH
jgi:hypothetical protein